jgi:hypothetical protein
MVSVTRSVRSPSLRPSNPFTARRFVICAIWCGPRASKAAQYRNFLNPRAWCNRQVLV